MRWERPKEIAKRQKKKNYRKWGNKEEKGVVLKCSFNPKEGRNTEEKTKE